MRQLVLGALIFVCVASPVFAHGGAWRGPLPLPRPNVVPTDPYPRPVPTPRPGAPTLPPGGPGTGTSLPPAPTPAPQGPFDPNPTGRPARSRAPSGPGLQHWVYWWNLNQERLLDLRGLRIARLRARTDDSSAHFFGEGDEGNTRVDGFSKAREEIFQTLLVAAKARNKDVATGAIVALGKAGDPRAVPLLMELALDEDADQTVNESAALAVGMIGKETGDVRTFLGRIIQDPGARNRTRAFAALGLGFLGDPGALPALMTRLTARESSREVPAASFLALGLLGDELVVPDLARMLSGSSSERHPDDILRGYAAAALGMIRSRAGLPALLRASGDKNREVRRQAVLSLGAVVKPSDDRAIQRLVDVLATDRDPQVSAFAAVSLGEVGSAPCANALLYAYKKGESGVVPYAALGLGLIARNTSDAPLAEKIRLLLRAQLPDRGNTDLKGALAIAVGIAQDRGSVPALLDLVRAKGDPDLRGHAAMALGLIGAEEAIPVLRDVLTERGDPDVQREVALALGLLADRTAVALLTDLVKNGHTEYVRGSAATAVGRLAGPADAEALREVLADEKTPATTRAFVAVALGLVMDPHPVPLLARLGEHFNHRMSSEAVAEVLTFL